MAQRVERERPRALLLVGPKGVGKSTLGRMLEGEFGVRYLDAEPICQALLAARGGAIDDDYAREAFFAVVAAAAALATPGAIVVLDTTATSDQTRCLLDGLSAHFEVHFIRVIAPREVCARRILARDATRHVAVPPELVDAMYDRTMAFQGPWDLVVENHPALSLGRVREIFAPWIAH